MSHGYEDSENEGLTARHSYIDICAHRNRYIYTVKYANTLRCIHTISYGLNHMK